MLSLGHRMQRTHRRGYAMADTVLALAADYRVVADTAAFNTSFAGVALTADSGISWTLPRVVGPGRAADLLLFPRSVNAQEAYELGIAGRVVPAGGPRGEAGEGGRGAGEGAAG